MEVDGPTVVAKTGPLGDHIPDGRLGASGHIGESRQEPRPAIKNSRHLSLLKHELGDQDLPRVTARPPGEIPPLLGEPPQNHVVINRCLLGRVQESRHFRRRGITIVATKGSPDVSPDLLSFYPDPP